jgi:uncharacterized phage protein gp47/JayE
MIQTPKSPSVYAAEILAALQGTGVKQTSPGGKARAFADAIAGQLGELEARQYINISQSLLPYATGDSLDFIGAIYNVDRIGRSDAQVSSSDDVFKFYVTSGTFGDINGGFSIVVPSGTKIFTDQVDGPTYILSADATLQPTDSSATISAISQSVGAAGNAAAGSFTRHNFTNYLDSRFGSLLVANDFGVVTGRDEEDDDSYRYRISLKLATPGGAAETDLRADLLVIPGIQDVVFKRLAGTFYAYVYGISPNVPPSLLATVQDTIDTKTAYPLKGLALAPDLVGISLFTTVKLKSGLSTSESANIINTAAVAAANYINNLATGEALILNEITDRIRNADLRILDVGDPNKPLQDIFIWRARLDDTRYSRYLVSNYSPAEGERIVVESITNAINLTVIS